MRISCVLRRCQNGASAVLLFDSGTLSSEDSFSHLLTRLCLTDSHLSIKEVPVCLWINTLHVCSGLHCKKKKKVKKAFSSLCQMQNSWQVLSTSPWEESWLKKAQKSPYSLLTRGTQGHLMCPWDQLLLPPLTKMHTMHLMRHSLSARLKEGRGSRGFEDQIIPL